MESSAASTEQTWYKNYFQHEYLPSQIAMTAGIWGKIKKKNYN